MEEKRHHTIIIASIIGILTNLLLVIFKTIVGLLSNSIAIILDAINNFSDMLSSLVTIIGAFFAARLPDREHPMGHGRSEYLSAAIVAIIIIYIGITAAIESIQKIFNPTTPDYSAITIMVVSVAVVAKVLLGLYMRRVGRKVSSDALVGSGKDALFDAAISLATLIAAIIFITTGFSTEAYLAILISAFVVYSGLKMLRDTFSVILGERVDSDLARKIRAEVNNVDGVKGAYDLMIHDYGPNMAYASINIELPDTMTALQVDDISREIRRRIYQKHHVIVSSVGVYSINTQGGKIAELRKKVHGTVLNMEHVIQMHGFHVNEATKCISLDLVVSFDVKNRHAFLRKARDMLKGAVPGYDFDISIDADFAD